MILSGISIDRITHHFSIGKRISLDKNSKYPGILFRFGSTNHLFNQLLLDLVQSFENKYYESQLINFINQYPHSSSIQQLAIEQIRLNIHWVNDGLAEYLDDAITSEE